MSINRDKLKTGELSKRELNDVDIRKNLIKLGLAFLLVFLIVILLRMLFGHHIQAFAEVMVDRFGLPGVFISTLFLDSFILGISPDFVLFVAIAGEIDPLQLLLTISIASILGGNVGYLIGRFLGNRKFVQKRIEPYEKRGHYLMEKYGLWAVIVGAMTPIPFSTICWIAGMLEMKYTHFLAGAIWRIPRYLLWYIVFRVGFSGFQGMISHPLFIFG
ncbi:MAG: DedA family protein [Candidatus Thermoplasmatota archaeon]|nr:DedA family protein [Candidatus Thermoplasmatota archaeon]